MDGNLLKATAEAHHKAIGSIDAKGVTSAADYEAVNAALGRAVASVPTSKVMDVYSAWARILNEAVPNKLVSTVNPLDVQVAAKAFYELRDVAEIAETKRTVFSALTRLRAATIKEFDTVAQDVPGDGRPHLQTLEGEGAAAEGQARWVVLHARHEEVGELALGDEPHARHRALAPEVRAGFVRRCVGAGAWRRLRSSSRHLRAAPSSRYSVATLCRAAVKHYDWRSAISRKDVNRVPTAVGVQYTRQS